MPIGHGFKFVINKVMRCIFMVDGILNKITKELEGIPGVVG